MPAYRVIRDSALAFLDDDVLTLSASLAFYTLLSFAPLMVLFVLAASSGGAESALLDQIDAIVGRAGRDAAAAVIASGKSHPSIGSVAGIIGLITAIIGATTVFAQLQSSLNVIFGIEAQPANAIWDWLRRRILSAGVVLAIAFVLVVSLLVSAALALLLPRGSILLDGANEAVSGVVFAGLFALLFRFLPDARIPWRFAISGGFVTAVLFAFGKWLIGIYLARADVGGAYGAAGSLVVLLVWVYYAGAVVFYGAEITKSWMRNRGQSIRPLVHAAKAS